MFLAEIRHHKTNFILGTLAVALAVTVWSYTRHSLLEYDAATEARLAEIESETAAEMKHLEDDIRKTMKGLGFNVFIFPEGEELWQIKQRGFSEKTMSQEYVQKLAESKIVTVNHLLPQLSKRVQWQEQNRSILLVGVKGQVPFLHRDPKKPIMNPLEPGNAFVGHDLAQSLKLKKGAPLTLNGKTYTIARTYPPRNFLDDGSIWIHLDEAQELFGQKNEINAILALGCNCASIDRLGEIRAELGEILPDVQIIELGSSAMVRAEARNKAGLRAKETKEGVLAQRQAARDERARFTSLISPLIALSSFLGITFLSFANIRERFPEIGTLRSIGFKPLSITGLLLGRALLTGLVGTLFALILTQFLGSIPEPKTLLFLIITIPLLTAAAAWLPTLHALTRDPLTILRHD